MYLSHLSLTNFRNYLRLELDLHPHISVFWGDNAQGKTNLLEAVYLLATGRSPHATNDREFINWFTQDKPAVARLAAEVQKKEGRVRLEMAMRAERATDPHNASAILAQTEGSAQIESPTWYIKKRIRVNGLERRALDLIGQIRVVMFSSQDIDLVDGPPALRRHYLDIINSQLDLGYFRALQRYHRVLWQRNHLLRLIRDQRAKPSQLAFWDQQLVEAGAYLIVQRRRTVAQLNDLERTIHLQLTGNRERLEILYVGSIGIESSLDASPELDSVGQAFEKELSAVQSREIAQGVSLVGPHRDDIRFLVNGVDMGVYGSRGQQRSLAISLRLAEARFMLAETGDQPILLLDDVLSELDEERCRYLLRSIALYQQVMLTATDLERFEPDFLAQAAKFRVREGRIEPIQC